MRTSPIQPSDWRGVFPVPPLARRRDARRTIDFAENDRIVKHMVDGGMTRFLYGGNAFLYHITLAEYEELLGWLNSFADNLWAIPSAGPCYGRLMDQAPLLRRYSFPTVMHLPSGDPRDAAGIEAGIRDFADACGLPLILYLKEENNWGNNLNAGLDAVARLVRDGICIGIKYAVVREDPSVDAYLSALLERVNKDMVVSGIGERPAIAHMRDFGLPGFTTGSGCLAPNLSNRILAHNQKAEWDAAEPLRQLFLPHEDLRDGTGPARVLHAATELAGVAVTGSIPPFITELNEAQKAQLAPVAQQLVASDAAVLSHAGIA
jgi:dihydrodipicolinate synthase/N-acetylneuraminate lyase